MKGVLEHVSCPKCLAWGTINPLTAVLLSPGGVQVLLC